MAFRFQKRVKLAPGMRLNLSKRGVSTSFGPRGASVSVGRRGVYGNVGAPGTGLSYRKKLSTSGPRGARNQNRAGAPARITLDWDDTKQDMVFRGPDDDVLPEKDQTALRRSHKELLRQEREKAAAAINQRTERLLHLHLNSFSEAALEDRLPTPLPIPREAEVEKRFLEEARAERGLLQKVLHMIPPFYEQWKAPVVEEAQEAYKEEYEEAILVEEEIRERQKLVSDVYQGNKKAMESWLSNALDELDFPLPTDLDFTVMDPQVIACDIHLPPPEKVPEEEAEVMKSGKLKIESKTQRDQRDHYARLIGGSALYTAGFFFAYAPTLQSLLLSGCYESRDSTTGQAEDVYVYSAHITREALQELVLEHLHPFDALEHFDAVTNATKTYVLKEITPLRPEDVINSVPEK
ncbi:DUF4236 domain-containing protein [Alkalicoccus chagannorensis]|uniref:DUF4236 domain-containing protein n=1 Tax=Alkalicoccus chagannorensis TaxID=427072 RepID=UPI000416168D|nr:DUF4236 domain-containing protein [Alkalicoccus chagannorensis]